VSSGVETSAAEFRGPGKRSWKRPWEEISEWLPLAVFAVYAVLPTKNYYWDGVSFALDIEQAGRFGSPAFWPNLIHPNHLLYNSIGYCAWTALRSFGSHVRAISVLQAFNMILAAVCVRILQRTLLWLTGSAYLSAFLALLFALSAVFWRFATDADAYIPSVLLLVASFHVLCTSSKPRPLVVGILHVGAMAVHQLAIFFFPAAAVGIYLKGGRRSLLQYCALTAGVTLPAYFVGFWLQQHSTQPRAFLRWLTFHSADSAFTFNLPKNLAITLTSYPRLFFGGTGHLLRFFGPFMLISVLALGGVLIMLLTRTIRYWDELRSWRLRFDRTLPLLVSVVWLATYAVFLFFWLPSNTFYKLFCLPAIIVIIAHVLKGYEGPRRNRVALFVATMAVANLAFYIFPYSRPDYNQAMRFAHRMARLWPHRTVVYYSDFIVDDWYIRYFNPRTTWKQVDPAGGATRFADEANQDLNSGNEVWIDGTTAEVLARNWPGVVAHFDAAQVDDFSKHPIRFYRWRVSSENREANGAR
jgi:hypothetical protein